MRTNQISIRNLAKNERDFVDFLFGAYGNGAHFSLLKLERQRFFLANSDCMPLGELAEVFDLIVYTNVRCGNLVLDACTVCIYLNQSNIGIEELNAITETNPILVQVIAESVWDNGTVGELRCVVRDKRISKVDIFKSMLKAHKLIMTDGAETVAFNYHHDGINVTITKGKGNEQE